MFANVYLISYILKPSLNIQLYDKFLISSHIWSRYFT